jgi:putative membrane protein
VGYDPVLYDWLRALHLIAVICWMAGLFYLPRLFVYHASVDAKSETAAIFKIMERKLYLYIMMPAMAASYVFGIWLIVENIEILSMPYMWVKLTLVAALTGLHFFLGKHLENFAKDQNRRTHRYFRFLNEVPTLLLIGIVIMVIVKPIL